MTRISFQAELKRLEEKKQLNISLRRHFRAELKKLRNLAEPNLITSYYGWSEPALSVSYHAKLADMRETERWLRRFALIGPLESITSSDGEDGIRTFRLTYSKKGKTLSLHLFARPDDENPHANCRRIQIGVETHTHTSTTPKYKILCD